MFYETFAADLPAGRTTTLGSAEENQEMMRSHGVAQELHQIGAGRFRCGVAVRSSAQVDLYAERFNLAFSMRLEPPRHMVGLVFLRSVGGEAYVCGDQAANERMIVVPDGTEIDIRAPALTGSEALTFSTHRFVEMTETLCPTPKSVGPKERSVIRGNTAELRVLRNALVALIAQPEEPDPEHLDNLLSEAVVWMGQSSRNWRSERLLGNNSRARVAKRVQEFVHGHFREVVRIEELCRLTGVGARTLQRSFREYFGVTVSQYLKALRLDRARRELVASNNSADSVTAIALRNGFRHLGRFSVEFREHFRESPRELLSRSPETRVA